MVVGIDAFVAYVNVALREDEEHEGLAYYINEKATPIPVSSCQFSFAQERRTNFFLSYPFYLLIEPCTVWW